MNCMKCGQEIEPNQVFCPDCLEEMAKHPVQPGVVIQLPARPVEDPVKKVVRRHHPVLSAEEQIKRLRKRVGGLILTVILLSALLISVGVFAYEFYIHNNARETVGQNYSTVETIGPKDPADFRQYD